MINNIITIDNLNDDLLIDFDTLTDNQKLLMHEDYHNNYFSINKFMTDYCITLSQFKQLKELTP